MLIFINRGEGYLADINPKSTPSDSKVNLNPSASVLRMKMLKTSTPTIIKGRMIEHLHPEYAGRRIRVHFRITGSRFWVNIG